MLKISNKWHWWIGGTALILCVSMGLWLPFFSQLPSGLNRDEAALGYNAYSLLQTGRDEWSQPWPISFTSFGDQKLPGYIYTLMPFIAVFGLETWVVRLPSLLAGLMVTAGMGLIAVRLAQSFKCLVKFQLGFSFLVMILTAISPWQMHFSRVAYETHLAMAFFVIGLASLLFAFESHSKLWQRVLLIKAGVLFSLAMLTYHSYQVFLPLFLFSLLIIYFKKIKNLDKIGLVTALAIGLGTIIFLFQGGVMKANQVKSIGISPFDRQSLLLAAVRYRQADGLSSKLDKLLFNRPTEGIVRLAQNYLSTISGTFFFIHGSGHGDHNPGNGNNLHLLDAPLILFGFLALWTFRKHTSSQLIFAWLFLALLPSALTISPLSEVRIATVFPILELIAALGVVYSLSFFTQKWQLVFGVVLLAIACLATTRLFIFYTLIAPRSTVDNLPYHQLAKIIFKYKSLPGSVLTQSPSSSPYIWYLLENKIEPDLAQKELVHYPATKEGFLHVQKIENIYFETINWDKLALRAKAEPYTLILKPNEFSATQKLDVQFQFLEVIKDQKGQVVYEVWQYQARN